MPTDALSRGADQGRETTTLEGLVSMILKDGRHPLWWTRAVPTGAPAAESVPPGGSTSGEGAPGGHQGHLSPEEGAPTDTLMPGPLGWHGGLPLPPSSRSLPRYGAPVAVLTHSFVSVSASGDPRLFPWPLAWDFCPFQLKWLMGLKDLPFLGWRPLSSDKSKTVE